MSQENVEVVRQVYEAFARNDPSATSWSASFNSYRVILHCTSDPNHAFYF